jgi:hypothetical protein
VKRRADKPISWLPASEYVARRRRRQRRLQAIHWLQLVLGVLCLIAAGVFAVVTR